MFRLPSINLAGKFELPYAWILGVQQDARESMVVPPEGTSVDIQFPGVVAPPQISETQDGSLQWFSERVGSAGRFSPSSQAKDVLQRYAGFDGPAFWTAETNNNL